MRVQNNEPAVNMARQLNDIAGVTINWDQWQNFNLDFLGLEGVVLFQFLMYECTRLAPKHEGWFYHSKDRIKKRTGIPNDRLDKIIHKLEKALIIETKVKGVPATLHYRIRFEELVKRERLDMIYRDYSVREKELTSFLSDFIVISREPELIEAHKPKAKEQDRDELEKVWTAGRDLRNQLNSYLQGAWQVHTKSVEENPDQGLKLLKQPKRNSDALILTAAIRALKSFSSEEIKEAAMLFFMARNFKLGGRSAKYTLIINIDVPESDRNPILILLDGANDYAFLRKCIQANK